jgi:hypothetical protein
VAGIFVVRTGLAEAPELFRTFNALTVMAALLAIAAGWRRLRPRDWSIALAAGALLGGLVPASHYNPFWDTGQPVSTGLLHGAALALVFLGGLTIMRQGGPVRVSLAEGAGRKALRSVGLGIGLGLPLAIVNVLGFMLMQDRPMVLTNPLAAALGALQPAIVEEAFYRLALLGFIWALLRPGWPRQAAPLAAAVSLLTHNYSHFGALFREQPLFALGYGAVVGLVFGLPMTVLALRRDLEAAAGCHWIVDCVRFAAGF